MAMSSSSFNLSSSSNSYLFCSAWTFSQTVLTQTLANSSFMCGSHSCGIDSISSLYPFITLSLVQGSFARYGSNLNPHQISKKISTLYLVPGYRIASIVEKILELGLHHVKPILPTHMSLKLESSMKPFTVSETRCS